MPAGAGVVVAAEKSGVAGAGDETFDEINVGFIRLGVLAVGVGGSSFGTGIGVILFGVLFSAVASAATGPTSVFYKVEFWSFLEYRRPKGREDLLKHTS